MESNFQRCPQLHHCCLHVSLKNCFTCVLSHGGKALDLQMSPAQWHLPRSLGSPAWSPPARCGMCQAEHGFLHVPDITWLLDSYECLISISLSCQPWGTRVSCDSGLFQCVSVSSRMSNLFLEMRISDAHLMPRHVALMYGMTVQSSFYSLLCISSSDAYKGATDNFVHTIIQSLSFSVTAKSNSWFRGVTFVL